MAQWVQVFAAEFDNINCIPVTHWVEGESCLLLRCMGAHTHVHIKTHTHKIYLKNNWRDGLAANA